MGANQRCNDSGGRRAGRRERRARQKVLGNQGRGAARAPGDQLQIQRDDERPPKNVRVRAVEWLQSFFRAEAGLARLQLLSSELQTHRHFASERLSYELFLTRKLALNLTPLL